MYRSLNEVNEKALIEQDQISCAAFKNSIQTVSLSFHCNKGNLLLGPH